MARVYIGEEISPKASTPPQVRRTNVKDRQTTDRRNCDGKYRNVTWSRSGKNMRSVRYI